MFSGKTTELMRRIRRYTHAKKRCQVIKYSKDTRYDADLASTHDLQKCEAIGCAQLSELDESLLQNVDVIGVDEGQFFGADIVEFADRYASRGKVVIVAALDATFERRPFGNILELIPYAEQVMKLNAVCMICHREASFSKRIGSETAVEVIGGAEKYAATCRSCYFAPNAPVNAPASPARAVSECEEANSNVSSPTSIMVIANFTPSPPMMLASSSSGSFDGDGPSTPQPSSPHVHTRAGLNSKRLIADAPMPLTTLDTNQLHPNDSLNRKRKEMASEMDLSPSKRLHGEKENVC